MKTNLLKTICFTAFVVLSISACKKEPQLIGDLPENEPYVSGVFILNEGPFQNGTGTVSFLNRSTKVVTQDIFDLENDRPLGNIVQSMTIFNDKAYIVVNNAGKVEIVNPKTFKSVGLIEGLNLPRFFMGVNSGKGYISDWSGNISVVNLSANSVSSTINVGGAPDKMVLTGNKVYVIGSAGFTSDSTLHIIDASTDTKINTLVVGDNPSDLVMDANNKIWIICGGISDWINPGNNTNATLVKFNPTINAVEQTYDLGSTQYSAKIVTNQTKTKLYYTLFDGIHEIDINNPVINPQPFIAQSFYAIGFDNTEGYLYGADPKDYTNNGWIYRFNVSNAAPVDSFMVGVIPTGFWFN